MRALSVFAAAVMVAAGFGSYALVSYWQDVDRSVPAHTGTVVGELAYWHEGETARSAGIEVHRGGREDSRGQTDRSSP